jgi:hypothetical protein
MASTKLLTEGFMRISSAAKATAENPLTARERFRLRHLHNWVEAILLFAVVAFLLVLTLPIGVASWVDLAVIAVLYYFVFYIWDKEPISFKCNHCDKLIESNTPWICGFKQCRNENGDKYPFVHRCEHCGAEPKAYQCHHCGNLIFFTKDELRVNFARCTRPFKERSDLDIPGLQDDLQKAGLELNIAQVDKQMARLVREPMTDPYEEDKRRRANEDAEMDHQLLMIKRRAVNAQAEANARALEEVNLPERDKAKRNYDRKVERFDIADEGRALVEKRFPKGSIQYERAMAVWQEYEERGSIRM